MPYYAYIKSDTGEKVSDSERLEANLPPGIEAVEVDGPGNGRLWDEAARVWGTPPPLPQSRLERAKALYPASDSSVPDYAKAIAVALGIKD